MKRQRAFKSVQLVFAYLLYGDLENFSSSDFYREYGSRRL